GRCRRGSGSNQCAFHRFRGGWMQYGTWGVGSRTVNGFSDPAEELSLPREMGDPPPLPKELIIDHLFGCARNRTFRVAGFFLLLPEKFGIADKSIDQMSGPSIVALEENGSGLMQLGQRRLPVFLGQVIHAPEERCPSQFGSLFLAESRKSSPQFLS